MQKNSSLLITGILSFSFYIFLCLIVVYYISSPPVKKYTSQTKVTILELDVIVEKSDKKRIEKKEDKKLEKKEEVIKKSASKSQEKKPDLKSLFANVSTKSTKVAKKEVNKVIKSIDPKRFKSKFEKQKKSSNVKLDKLLNDKKTTTNVSSSSKTKSKESDEYVNSITELLYKWNPLISNLIAIVDVTIYPNGRFDYRFKKYSGNTDFDISLKAFLEEQKSIIYPKPKLGKNFTLETTYKIEG